MVPPYSANEHDNYNFVQGVQVMLLREQNKEVDAALNLIEEKGGILVSISEAGRGSFDCETGEFIDSESFPHFKGAIFWKLRQGTIERFIGWKRIEP